MRLSLLLDPETAERLKRLALAEHRPPRMQAEVLLRRALEAEAAERDEARSAAAGRAS